MDAAILADGVEAIDDASTRPDKPDDVPARVIDDIYRLPPLVEEVVNQDDIVHRGAIQRHRQIVAVVVVDGHGV